MFYAILSLCLLGGALAQVPGYGQCPKVQTASDFKLPMYMGTWYETRRYFSVAEITDKCITAHYKWHHNNKIEMETSKISILTGNKETTKSVARVPDLNDPARLRVKHVGGLFDFEFDYLVLGTDYSSYAVVYTCQNTKHFHVKHAWILTRERNPSDSVIQKALAVAERNHLRKFMFVKSNQSNC